nr:MAG TPA: hypothetical protein [Caudoviricetes sp.]
MVIWGSFPVYPIRSTDKATQVRSNLPAWLFMNCHTLASAILSFFTQNGLRT